MVIDLEFKVVSTMKIILLLLSLVFFMPFVAQTDKKYKPISFTQHFPNNIPVVVMPEFNLQQVLNEEEINIKNGTGMYRFGYEHQVNIDFFDEATQVSTPKEETVFRLAIKSSEALSLNLIFNHFYLPENDRLFVYDKNKETVVGAYTSINNNQANTLGTELIKGDEMIIEYIQSSPTERAILNIGTVVHGYLDINNWYSFKVNESGACNMDVICPDGDDWRSEIRAVVRIMNGGGLCSGTLINNTAQDGTPYILTANHCSPQSMASAVFRFNYDSPICGSQTTANSQAPSNNDVVNGSSFKARNPNSDFGLVELNSIPPANYNVFYAGWNNSGATPTHTVGIHHPHGDVKKISFDDNPPTSGNIGTAVANAEWRILAWDRNTTTEGGSSGSGLFDQNRLLIGQLHGGQATCSNSINDYYGKFAISWNGNSPTSRLRDWLDPTNSGVQTLSGFDPNASMNDVALVSIISPDSTFCGSSLTPVVEFKNVGSDTLSSLSFQYGVDGFITQNFDWQGNLAPNDEISLPLSAIQFSNAGDFNFTITASQPNHQVDGDTANNSLSVSFRSLGNCLAYPNPFTDELTVLLEQGKINNSPVSLFLIDAQGKEVLNIKATPTNGDNKIVLDTSSIHKGMYMLKFVYKDNEDIQKVVKY